MKKSHFFYANKGISEYWIVDPLKQQITVLTLQSGTYQAKTFTSNDAISSPLFPEIDLTVDKIWQN